MLEGLLNVSCVKLMACHQATNIGGNSFSRFSVSKKNPQAVLDERGGTFKTVFGGCPLFDFDSFYHVASGGRNAAGFGQGVVPRGLAVFRTFVGVFCVLSVTPSRIYNRRNRDTYLLYIFVCDEDKRKKHKHRVRGGWNNPARDTW